MNMKQANLPKRFAWIEPVALAALAVWWLAGMITTPLRVTVDEVEAWAAPIALKSLVILCLQVGDPMLMVLAAVNTHLVAVRAWGAVVARRWGLCVLVSSAVIETVGTLTSYPFGDYFYTKNFGPLIAGVLPFTIPLAWHVILTNSYVLLKDWRPQWSRVQAAAGVATMGTLIDFVMGPFATRIKAYWVWRDLVVPWQNYVAWWCVGFALVWVFAPRRENVTFGRDWRPAFILGGIVLLFVVTRVVYGV
jgi:uncharacterized membrane protein